MKTFEYTAVARDGATVHGLLGAASELALDADLLRRGLVLTRARETRARAAMTNARLSADELIHVAHQLSTLVSAGVHVVDALSSVGERMERESARLVLARVVESLRRGASLSEALEKEPRSFPPVFRASVRAGEASGALDRVLSRVAQHLTWLRGIRATTKQALIYPAMLALALTGLVLVLLYFVLPRLMGLFPGGRDSLPAQTRLVLAASDFLRENAWWLAGLTLAATVGGRLLLARPEARAWFDAKLLGLPLFGSVWRQLAASKFASTASILQGAGCDVFTLLEVSGKTSGNRAMEDAFQRVSAGVRRGQTLSQGLDREPLVDPLLVQMVAVGEKSGSLEVSLGRLAAHYDEEIPRRVKRLLSLLEPALLLIAGAAVAFILLAAILPIFTLYGNIR